MTIIINLRQSLMGGHIRQPLIEARLIDSRGKVIFYLIYDCKPAPGNPNNGKAAGALAVHVYASRGEPDASSN